jgi:hypothetical protein
LSLASSISKSLIGMAKVILSCVAGLPGHARLRLAAAVSLCACRSGRRHFRRSAPGFPARPAAVLRSGCVATGAPGVVRSLGGCLSGRRLANRLHQIRRWVRVNQEGGRKKFEESGYPLI